jgi:Zn-dependent protease with chaperone function
VTLPPILLPLAVEWVILVTSLVPLLARNRGDRRPNIAIFSLFASLASAVIASLLALGIAVEYVVDLWQKLNATPVAKRSISETLQSIGVSFAPWLLLAVAGITIALINLRLEPQIQAAREAHPQIAQLLKPVGRFAGRDYFSVGASAYLSFTTKLDDRQVIVISTAALQGLEKNQLDAILWHEIAHIELGHHRLKVMAQLLQSITPRIAASKTLVVELARLCEISADNYAAKRVSREVIDQTRALFA